MPPSQNPVHIDDMRCKRCGACVQECPAARFHDYVSLTQVGMAECLACGHCIAVCVSQAVTHTQFDASEMSALPTDTCRISDVLAARRSIRHYLSHPVAREHLDALVQTMRHAPSGMNSRPVQALVITDAQLLAEVSAQTMAMYRQLTRLVRTPLGRLLLRAVAGREAVNRLQSALPELTAMLRQHVAGHDPVLHSAPALLLLHAARTGPCGHDDCLLAAMSAMLTAPSLGLGTCMIGFVLPAFQRLAQLRVRIGLPAGHEVYAVLTVGYPGVRYQAIPPRPAVPVQWR